MEITVKSNPVDHRVNWQLIRRSIRIALLDAGIESGIASVLLTDDKTIRGLNRHYRKKDSATDVLSFSQLEGPEFPESGDDPVLGDIVISLETVARRARGKPAAMRREAAMLAAHGAAHLAGMDHVDKAGRKAMESLQDRVISQLEREGRL